MEEQKKNNLKEKLSQIKQTVFSFFKKVFLKIKNALVFVAKKIKNAVVFAWSKIKAFFKKVWEKVKPFFKKIWSKIKVFLKNAWAKTKQFFKWVYLKIKGLNVYIKIAVLVVLILSIAGSAFLTYLKNEKIKNLTSYNIINETIVYQNMFVLEDDFFEVDDSVIPENISSELKDFYIVFEAMKSSYNYYAGLLKSIKNANNNMRNYINGRLNYVEERSNYVNSYSKAILIELEQETPDVEFLDNMVDSMLFYLKDLVHNSRYLLPEIENYIFLYGNEIINNKLQVYLIKLQFHYASTVVELLGQGQDATAQLNDLKNIIKKFAAFTGTSNSVYKEDFINAYENYYAYNYYMASDKNIYRQRLDLSQEDKAYAQAFYNFLMQASYN